MAENEIKRSNQCKKRKGCNSSNNHIRFDQEDGDAATRDMLSSSIDAASSSPSSASTSDKTRKNKRKRKHASRAQEEDAGSKLFNGLIVAISTLESKHKNGTTGNDDDLYQNHKTLKHALQVLGATISPQVHKRVHYLISTDNAVQNLTQRVRQALKRNVNIIDVAWVKECNVRKKRVNVDEYSRDELAKRLMEEKEEEKKLKLANEGKGAGTNNKLDEGECSDAPGEDNAGWSSPIELDCCCVCHENGDDNCPWCTDCNLTLARLAAQK